MKERDAEWKKSSAFPESNGHKNRNDRSEGASVGLVHEREEGERERLFGMRGMRREKATEQKIAAFMTKLYGMNSDSELYPST